MQGCLLCGRNDLGMHQFRFVINANGEENVDFKVCYKCSSQIELDLGIDFQTFVDIFLDNLSGQFDDFSKTNTPNLKDIHRLIDLSFKKTANRINFQENPLFPPVPPAQSGARNRHRRGVGRNNVEENVPPFLENLSENAEKYPDIYFREEEIADIIRIMSRKNKNNPILVGDAGVGKTSLIEYIAKKIKKGKFPFLKDHTVYSFNISSFMSGTSYRGSFEKNFEDMMNYIKGRKAIIFIDEIHQIMGAGSSDGAREINLENLLKPFLVSNDFILIGATTPDEFRALEKDPAFLRRMQRTNIHPLSKEQTLQVLKNVRADFVDHHKVNISDEALEVIVKLSDEFVKERNFPDKALDVLDESMSFVRMSDKNAKMEQSLKEFEKFSKHFSPAVKEKLKEALLQREVTKDDIRKVVERISGVPSSAAFSIEDRQMVRNIDSKLKKRVIGQDQAIDRIAKALQRKLVQLSGRTNKRPVVLFLAGPTGVGKTETAKAISEVILGDEKKLIRFDMSEFTDKASINRLIGSPPGYIGHDEEGELTEAVRQNPFSVILLDEFEKSSPEISKLFLQLFDDGVLTDSKGRRVDFSNTIILLTSNIGSGKKASISLNKTAENSLEKEEERLLSEMKKVYPPEFINRIDDFIVFEKLTKEDLQKIAIAIVNDLKETSKEKGINFDITLPAIKHLSNLGYDEEFGARPLLRTIQKELEDLLVKHILNQKEDNQKEDNLIDVKISLSDGELITS